MGDEYRYGSHNVFDVKLHIVWVTKYRYPVLTSKIKLRIRELLRQICESHEVNIVSGVISSDHIHMLVSIAPQISISRLVMNMKGRTSHIVQREFPELRKRYWGQHFWARGYFCASVGKVTEQTIQDYIAGHINKENENKITVDTGM